MPREQAEMVIAFVRTIFAQPNTEQTRRQLNEIVAHLETSMLKAAKVLANGEDDVTAYATFPRHHRHKFLPTNPLERVNTEIKRRPNVVGEFPNANAVLRLVGAMLAERNDEWQASDRCYLTIINVTTLGLDQLVTFELEAA